MKTGKTKNRIREGNPAVTVLLYVLVLLICIWPCSGIKKPLKQVIIWLSSGCLVSDFSLIKNSFTLV